MSVRMASKFVLPPDSKVMTDKKEGQSNLAGWAAVITACAGVITAFGFPSFFPDLVKHYFTASSQQFSSLRQDQAVPPSTQDGLPHPIPASSPETKVSPADVVLSLRQGMDYVEARNKLLSSGWMPVEADKALIDSQTTMSTGETFPEISCQGTGLGLCDGKFQLEDGRSLEVTIAGQPSDGYSLLFLNSSFYIEPSKTTLDVVDQLKPGLQYRKVEQLLISEGWQTYIRNPMHRQDELPGKSHGFLEEFSHFEDCAWDDYDIIDECRFILSTAGGRRLVIVTNVESDGTYYEPTLKAWNLE
ncbi:hypothetical protein C7293_07560 [filamentous cyanobacterium CCT1]|nr:hypothetical protein C7293_07560 [filamentous cyanobacterium CCT1]PSN76713.1 hypothetical protein C8B47_25865 [filamentous cyanobacterium CCP4]